MVTWRHLLEGERCFTCNCRDESRYTILGLPMDWTTTYMPGTRFAPDSIREASCNIELYSILAKRDIEDIHVRDLGNVSLVYGDVYSSFERIMKVVEGIREEYSGNTYFFLGGEHSVTYPILKILNDSIDHIIVFDAHGDLRDEYMGLKYSHATVTRRVLEEIGKPVTLIGVRALSKEERRYLEEKTDNNPRIVFIDEYEYFRRFIPGNKNIYVSLDMDVFDPGYAPGVSNPEPLGLTPHQVLTVLGELLSSNRLVGMDVVEVNPLRDVNNITSILAARIIIEVIGLISSR